MEPKTKKFVVVIELTEELFSKTKDEFLNAVTQELLYATCDMTEYLQKEWEVRNPS
jgi:hypothetical protein